MSQRRAARGSRLLPQVNWFLERSRKRTIHAFCSRLYRDPHRDVGRSILVAGVGRSGTTWLANVIASQLSCRIIWEPFNPQTVDEFSGFPDFLYRRRGSSDPELLSFATRVLEGAVRNSWVDREILRFRFDCRLVKVIRANLMLGWLRERFPELPLIFMTRHPCAVVLSRMQAQWGARDDLDALLAQPELAQDFLQSRTEEIDKAQSLEAQHALLWCIQHLVPMRQLQGERFLCLFYENLCLRPEEEIARIFGYLERPYRSSVFKILDTPSKTALSSSAIRTGEDRITNWARRLSPRQVGEILAVVESFGLGFLYSDSVLPQSDRLTKRNAESVSELQA